MNRKPRTAFVILSVLVLLTASFSILARVSLTLVEGRRAAQADFDELLIGLRGVARPADLSDQVLRQRLSRLYAASPSLLLAFVAERDEGLLWRLPARSPYLYASENDSPQPRVNYPSPSALLLSSPLTGDPTGHLSVQALYVVLPQGLVYLAFRDAALVLAAWLLLSLILLLVFERSRADATWRVGAEDLARSGDFAPAREPREAETEERGPGPQVEEAQSDHDRERDLSGKGPGGESSLGDNFFHDDFLEEGDFESEARSLEPRFSTNWEEEDEAAGEIPPRGRTEEEGEERPQGLFSPLSGLGWESYLEDRLDAELSRAASFEQDLSFLLIEYEGLAPGSPGYARLAKAVADFFSFKDLAFERGQDGFAVILPNLDADHALRMAEEFHKKATILAREEGAADPLEALPLFMGLSSRAGRLVEATRLLGEGAQALEKAHEETDSKIVAFKPDPDKYRLFLASRGI